jgi:hypothetical protein
MEPMKLITDHVKVKFLSVFNELLCGRKHHPSFASIKIPPHNRVNEQSS